MTQAQPPQIDGALIVAVVAAYRRNWPDRALPIFRAADVLPLLLSADDRVYTAASSLLDTDRVHYPEGTRP